MRYIVFLLTLLISVNAYALVNWNNAGIWNEFQTSDTVDITLDEDEVGLSITANDTQTSDLVQMFGSDGTTKWFSFLKDSGNDRRQFHIYGSYTDASNYERLQIEHRQNNKATIFTQAAGSGTVRELELGRTLGGAIRFTSNYIRFFRGGTEMLQVRDDDLWFLQNGNIGDNGSFNPTNIFYDGKSVPTPQAVSCTCSDDPTCGADATAGTLTLEPTSDSVRITNADPNGCDVTLSETNAIDGHMVRITVVSNAGGNVAFADTSGVTELTGAVNLDIWDTLDLEYVSDRWVMRGTSNN